MRLELSPRQRMRRLLRLQAMYGLFATLHWSLGYRFLVVDQGFSLQTVLLVPAVIYLASFLILLMVRRFEPRTTIRLGFLFRILTILPYAFWPTLEGILLGSVFFGLAIVAFWVPYNIMYFEHRARTTSAGMSAIYAAVAPFIDVVAALVAGWMVVRFGYQALFVASILVGVVPLVVSLRLRTREPLRVALRERLSNLHGLRTLMFLGGLKQGVVWPAVPLATLIFIEGTFAYAGFFAFLGLFGALAAILLGRFSDRKAKRILFVLPFSILFGLANIMSALAVNILQWGIWRGVAQLAGALYEPFQNAIFLDKADDVVDLYVGREFLLNAGRGAGVAILALFVHFDMLQLALVVPGILGFVFPLIIEAKDLYPEERLVLKPFRAMFRQ